MVADSAAKAKEARASGAATTSPSPIRDGYERIEAPRGDVHGVHIVAVPDEEDDAARAEEVAAFCFPHGVEPRLLERTPSMGIPEIMCGSTF